MPKIIRNAGTPNKIDYKMIGQRLKIARGKRTLADFSNALGFSPSYVSNCEHGAKPSLEYLIAISQTFNVSLNELILGYEPQEITHLEKDADFEMMVSILEKLTNSPDPDIRAWTKIQFNRAFKDLPDLNDDTK